MRSREGDASGLALFAAELAAHRARAGLSQDELGSQISYSGSLVAMIEHAAGTPARLRQALR
jgi:ribosome-binding protein aMBF1 (putative translation factor)